MEPMDKLKKQTDKLSFSVRTIGVICSGNRREYPHQSLPPVLVATIAATDFLQASN
jgi:neutral trehalase